MTTREILRAYRVPLDPTDAQSAALASHAGASRAAFNWALGAKVHAHRMWSACVADLTYTRYGHLDADQALAAAKKDASRYYRIPTSQTNEKAFDRDPDYAWRTEVNRRSWVSGMRQADTAWQNWLDSLTGRRAGRRVGYPRFKSKGRCRDSFTLAHDVKRPSIRPDGYRRLTLPKKISVTGSIRLKGNIRHLARRIRRGVARIQSATISRAGNGWSVSILALETLDIPDHPTPRQQAAGAVGVDVGVHHLMAFSDATIIDNPRHLRAAQKRLTRAQRALSRSKWRLPNGDLIDTPKRGQRVTPTTGRVKARARLAREHAAVAQHRASTLHAITKQLATSHAVVAVDDLNVAVMTRSARGSIDKPGRNVAAKAGLNRSILDASFAEMRRQLTHKTSWYRSQLLPSGCFVPTSRTCSTCGAEKANLPLSERVYHCENCATVLDRDVNAAKNVLRAALASHDAPGMEESQNARGGRGETSVARRSAKREDPPRGGPPRPCNRVRSSPPDGEAKVRANASPTNCKARKHSTPQGSAPRTRR